jgi:hypothetical protein
MPRQNRSDPAGSLHAVPYKGTLMGNRGRLHEGDRIVRQYDSTIRWISCTLEPVFGRRTPMGDSYTEIFFLDEVTALAAGHRPCAQCSRGRYASFVDAWEKAGLPTSGRKAETIDRVLDAERRSPERPVVGVEGLPDGCVVRDAQGSFFAVFAAGIRRWSFEGYGPAAHLPNGRTYRMVTPESIVRTLRAGYQVERTRDGLAGHLV